MQRNVTKCIGVAGKAAPWRGSGAIPRPRLARYSRCRVQPGKRKGQRAMLCEPSLAGLLGLSLPSSHFADEVFQIAGFELRHGERPRRAGSFMIAPMTAAMIR